MLLLKHSRGILPASFYTLEHPENLDRIVLASPLLPRRSTNFQQLTANFTAWMDTTTTAEAMHEGEAANLKYHLVLLEGAVHYP